MVVVPSTGHSMAENTPRTMTPEAVFAALASSPRGLSAGQAAQRLVGGGRNELPAPRRRSPLRRFASQFTDLFAVVLLVAAGITMLAPGSVRCRRGPVARLATPWPVRRRADGPRRTMRRPRRYRLRTGRLATRRSADAPVASRARRPASRPGQHDAAVPCACILSSPVSPSLGVDAGNRPAAPCGRRWT
ncbi:cation-transporting P-type ATPase [Dactylosporangium sp. NPDC049742]|uniref:cation-transporting P-type ATPase n=1 Tax=Dactylosporangium sp. NPDC049742 TaxID=3154737 RepID=UPI00343B9A08